MIIPHIPGTDADIAARRLTVTAWTLAANTAARQARGLLRAQVTGHVTEQSVLDDLDLMVSELATNAVVHTHGPYEMRILCHASVPVRCEIADAGGGGLDEITAHLRRKPDPISSVDALPLGGRGLRVVAHLSGGRCGAYAARLCGTGQPGKSVWFAIPAR
jgi:anti-sigma regulatory factor (Ser/Thr protein kinase)